MINSGIEIVRKAIAADGKGDYEVALKHYRDALQHFIEGLKYEKNSSRKELILRRVQRYMTRAEELAQCVEKKKKLAGENRAAEKHNDPMLLFNSGAEKLHRATVADGNGEYELALQHYSDAMKEITTWLKYQNNSTRKELFLRRLQGYLTRAEELVEYVKLQNERRG